MSEIALPKVDKSILIRKKEIVKKLSKFVKNAENILSEADEVRPYETDALSVYTQTL